MGVESSDGLSRARLMCERDATNTALGIELLDLAPGRATVRMRVAETMLNGHRIVHGGYVFLLADAAFAAACNTHGPVTVAQGAQVTFLRPAEAGEELTAQAAERERFGRNGIYDVTVRRSGGEVVAEFRGQSVMLSGAKGQAAAGQ
jgi:acyl-CoA thioesterase